MKSSLQYFLSALTAFTIAGGGSILSVIGSGFALNDRTWVISGVIGAMAASKDIRSLMRMPPVSETDNIKPPTETKP